MTDNVAQLPQLNTAGAFAMGNGSDIGSNIYPHQSHDSTYTNGSAFTNGSIPPTHARSHSREDLKFDGSTTPENQDSLYEEQQQELKKLKNQQKAQLLTAAQSNGMIVPHPVYNTRIRHGFDIEFESEQYMKLLAEVWNKKKMPMCLFVDTLTQ
jgi:hypothetical protein